MKLLACLDASGSGLDPNVKVIAVGGFAGSETTWANFESTWRTVLHSFGIRALHMREYAHSRGEFATWRDDSAKRDAFMQEIARAIESSGLQSFGATLPLETYRRFDERYRVAETIGEPYTVTVWAAIGAAVEWRDRNHPGAPLAVCVERGDNQQSDLRRQLAQFSWPDDAYLAGPTFLDKKSIGPDGLIQHSVPFQACDFVAYEQAKALTNFLYHQKTQVRQSLRHALPAIEEIPDGNTYWKPLLDGVFHNLVRNVRIPPRQATSSTGR